MRKRDNVKIISGAFNGCAGYILGFDKPDMVHVRLKHKEDGERFEEFARRSFTKWEIQPSGGYAVEI